MEATTVEWSGEFQDVSETTWCVPIAGLLFLVAIAIGLFVLHRRRNGP